MNDGYYVEWNGEQWQSVFPKQEADKSSLHDCLQDAFSYMTTECGIPRNKIAVLPLTYSN